MIFIYRFETGEVTMCLENGSDITYDETIMGRLDYEPTTDELDKIQQNWRLFVKNTILILEKNAFVTNDEAKTERINKILSAQSLDELKSEIISLIS